jgi:glutathione synthase
MTSSLTAIPQGIDPSLISRVVRDAKDYALCNGLCLRPRESLLGDDLLEVAPLSLFPSPFPRRLFNLSKNVQTSVNALMNAVSHDPLFIENSLRDTVKVDDFTRSLLKVYNESNRIGLSQTLSLGLFRTDYMIHEEGNQGNGEQRLLQVESNAIASGFANLGPKVTRMHEYILNKYTSDPEAVKTGIPKNEADFNFPISFIRAFEHYGNPAAVILFVVEDRTVNLCDQRGHDFAISKIRPDIKVLRRTWNELHSCVSVDENRRLLIDSKIEVAIVYYRVLYDPSQYSKGEESWKLRLKIETSQAIKCPTIGYQLSGVKKFQEVLTDKEILLRFLPEREASELSQTFADFFTLDEEGAVAAALKNPNKFVMKPQREGGGHNLYGEEIVKRIQEIRGTDERHSFILMQMIEAPVVDNILIGRDVYPSSGHIDPVTCELGIFGSILSKGNNVIFNHEDGHVLRCKKLGVNEGGISAGFGAIDSPFLY